MNNIDYNHLNDLMKKYTSFNDIEDVLKIYDRNNLSYHNREHILNMLDKYYNYFFNHLDEYILHVYLDEYIHEVLILAIIFHDSVYTFENGIANKFNEEHSADLADTFIEDKKTKDYVRELIEFTTYKENIKDYIKRINSNIDPIIFYFLMILDLGHLLFENDLEYLIKQENKVRLEYSHFDDNIYKHGRYEVLTKLKKYFLFNYFNIISRDNEYVMSLLYVDINNLSMDKILNYIELKGKLNY